MQTEKYLTIGALTKYLKYKFDTDVHLQKVFLKGEISNLKIHTTGHLYLSLKDETSKINAIMFASNAKKLPFVPKDGMKVFVTGRISVYEATGNYQIYIEEMIEDGIGNLYIAFEQLKEKLAKEGLFDSSHKKKIPSIPMKIGIVTAPTGAAIRDILSTIKRRFPLSTTYLFPSLVQGEFAREDIVKKIEQANRYDLDVLIVGRGGGSIEDLWPFNEEMVARAIYNSRIPVVSAVGHEIDFTISDYVADLRAPTPTGAAEMVVPNSIDLMKTFEQYKIRATEAIYQKYNYQKLFLESLKNSFVLKNPLLLYENKKQKIDLLLERAKQTVTHKYTICKQQFYHAKEHYILRNPETLLLKDKNTLTQYIEKLKLVSPLNILSRGYSLTKKQEKIIKSVHELKKDDEIEITFHEGKVAAKVTKIKEKKDENRS